MNTIKHTRNSATDQHVKNSLHSHLASLFIPYIAITYDTEDNVLEESASSPTLGCDEDGTHGCNLQAPQIKGQSSPGSLLQSGQQPSKTILQIPRPGSYSMRLQYLNLHSNRL
ncbi:hypothetical protein FRX31_033796 [Thalictrum thalictroides]|uniref:Uncharacterized protein n=1 Tax=Thalictrum thalictroides TaxID=46969 RepID=A0A7J6UVK0_THATH|nr:hypothetical protein FRX31_033796 [Thalictrum thalictroides]